jgi:hypothetical protein
MSDPLGYDAARETEEWDGRPKVAFTPEQMQEVYGAVPQWHGLATGPAIPFGGGARVRVFVTMIFRETREEVESVMWTHIRRACAVEHLEFEADEWSVRVMLMNGG